MSSDFSPVNSEEDAGGPPLPGARRSRLAAACRRALKRLHEKREKQAGELAEAASSLRYRQIADSIMACPDDFPRGTRETEIINVHTEKIETAHLNAKLNAHENAELLYKKAQKGKRGREIIEGYLALTDREIALVAGCSERLSSLDFTGEESAIGVMDDLEKKLIDLGIVQPAQTAAEAKREQKAQVPYRHMTVDGWDLYIGRNDSQNDELTTRFARPWDLWMHVGQYSGSHVVVRREKNAAEWPPQKILAIAASLTVWFSKAKHTSYAEVHVAEKRYVSKRRNAPAGQVMLSQYKTIRAAPLSPQDLFRKFPELKDGSGEVTGLQDR